MLAAASKWRMQIRRFTCYRLGPTDFHEVASIRKNNVDRGLRLPDKLICVQNETYEALSAADAAAVTSGTATLEAGILGTPMAVVYKVPRFDYQLLKPFVDVPHIGLINLIAGERLAKELIQNEFTAETLSDELLHLLDANVEMRAAQAGFRRVTGESMKRRRAR
jgi:lipid-A-disaccharide synthase